MKHSLKKAWSGKNRWSRFLPCLLVLCLVSLRAVSQSPASSTTQQYIAQYKSIAEEEMQRTGVPAAISLAQGIIESQSGTGWLVEHSHNHFGIKCKSDWTGQTIHHDDDHRNECFRVYQTDDSSWRDHSDFLKNTPRYAFLFYLDPTDYKAWAYGLKKAGYATSNHYAAQLIRTIETYHLEQYTTLAMAGMKNAPSKDFADMLEKKVDQDRKQMGEAPPVVTAPPPAEASASPYPAGPFQINDRQVVYLPKGTRLIGVAAKNHIRLSRLIKDNELPGSVLEKNMLVFLEKKKKTGAHETHMVDTGETLHEIAQQEGIRLKWLRRRNRISAGEEPAAGSILYLQGYAPEPGGAVAAAQGAPRAGFFYKLTHLFSGHQEAVASETSPERTIQGRDEAASGAAKAPGNEQSATPRAIYKPEGQATSKSTTYKVQKGDTLYGISRKYGVTVEQIQTWNNLAGNDIRVGQELILRNKQQ